ncbi:MAG: transmembrane anchor protein [Alphaproteobacteria bacterium]
MYNTNIPTDRELPSTGKLIKSTILAAATASILLVTVVMPSEYGIDPTGIGQYIGLKKMGDTKVSLAKEAAADKAIDLMKTAEPITTEEYTIQESSADINRNDQIQITLAPDEGTEIKAKMKKGSIVNYEWWTNGKKANFDVHGDSKKLKINYHKYYKGSDSSKSGKLTAAFDGSHGWFWRNRSDAPMTITLKVNGDYSGIKEMK